MKKENREIVTAAQQRRRIYDFIEFLYGKMEPEDGKFLSGLLKDLAKIHNNSLVRLIEEQQIALREANTLLKKFREVEEKRKLRYHQPPRWR